MKANHTSYLSLLVFLAVSLVLSEVKAFEAAGSGQSTYLDKAAYEASLPSPPSSTDRMGISNCGDISDLTFVGLKFIGAATCIPARDDNTANGLCNAGRHVNPGNPQYGGSGTLSSNTLGYYYCIPDDARNRKATMCTNLAKLYYPYLTFEYRAVGNDGNCWCGYNGNMQMCNEVTSINTQALASACGDAQNPNVFNRAWTAEQVADELVSEQARMGSLRSFSTDKLFCKCNQNAPEADRNTFVTAPATATSCGANGAALAAAAAPGTPTPTQQEEFDRCLTDYRRRAMDCQSQANTAKDTCRDKIRAAQNSPLNIAGNMVGALGQVGMAANAGSGNQQNCFGAGVGMMGVREALRMGRETCQSEYGTCENTCRQENFDRMQVECPAKLRDSRNQPLDLAALDQQGGDNATKFRQTREEIQRMANEGRQICTRDAGGANEDMSRLMNGLGRSIQGSMQCACNLSSQSSNCSQIPTIQSCETNPTLPNCQIYGAIETCNPSAPNYNQQQCNCVQNPSSCTTVSGTPPPNIFGNPVPNALSPSAFAGNGMGGGGAGGGARGYTIAGDSGGGEAQAVLGGTGFAGGAQAGAPAGGGLSGGGGSGGGEGPAQVGMMPGEGEGKGLAGLFNQARTAISSALGLKGGAPAKSSVSSGKPGGKDDLTKFKPRGLASAGRNGIGSANMDIFGMIKMCAQGDTCETNRPKSAWILTP